ncbi:Hint domain-containing protein [Neptunicoccus sediminis]|uniref:Hint domain-containing protein n=1 Tax=Neptunicoccus sediminis TaxID=1892596 RepID=UPI000845F687|nr:Hint domain-containing protein [Neptunicoccus sediminis]
MAEVFNVLYLGNLADIDTQDGNFTAENANALVGLTFGKAGDPLVHQVKSFSSGSTGSSGGISGAYDQTNNPSETFRIDGGPDQIFDASAVYNATVSYADGTTAAITAVIFQDTEGNTYLAPEFSANADQAALEAGPIRSLTLDSLAEGASLGLAANRETANYVACFTKDVMIAGQHGQRAVQDLAVGDLVRTQDHGLQAIRWTGAARRMATGGLRPVRIRIGALGVNLPAQDLVVSQQHRILVRSPIVARMTGNTEVFVAAKFLLGLDGVSLGPAGGVVTYYHLLLDRHEVIYANGMPTESLMTGRQALYSIGLERVNEILTLFPGLWISAGTPARPVVKGSRRKNLVARHVKNNKPLHAPRDFGADFNHSAYSRRWGLGNPAQGG